jgi:hypothetical protein
MHFDTEGHVVVTPRQWQKGLTDPGRLTRDVWLPGTPWAFPTYTAFRTFLAFLADRLAVHPNSIAIRGSTKVGFSISPKAAKVWGAMRPDSDLDLAIVDPDYYHFFDREIRSHERRLGAKLFQGTESRKAVGRRESRKFYTYRYPDLPDIGCVQDHQAVLAEAPVEQCCGSRRSLTAFIYRDWWSVHARCEYDLRDLRRALATPGFPAGGDTPRQSPLLLVATDAAVADAAGRRCDKCGGELQSAPGGERFFCPRCDVPTGPAPEAPHRWVAMTRHGEADRRGTQRHAGTYSVPARRAGDGIRPGPGAGPADAARPAGMRTGVSLRQTGCPNYSSVKVKSC